MTINGPDLAVLILLKQPVLVLLPCFCITPLRLCKNYLKESIQRTVQIAWPATTTRWVAPRSRDASEIVSSIDGGTTGENVASGECSFSFSLWPRPLRNSAKSCSRSTKEDPRVAYLRFADADISNRTTRIATPRLVIRERERKN